MAANSYSNFIPMRMRGQSWMIGNISVLKILFALLGVIIPCGVILPFLVLENSSVAVAIILGMFIILNQLLIWIPTSSGHTLAVALWLKFVYKVSYNNFKNQSQAKIFDIYKYKTDIKKLNETLKLKWEELKKNPDGSYSMKVIKKNKVIVNKSDNFETLRKNGIIKIQDGLDKTKNRYFVGFRIIGFDISNKSLENIENIISGLHNIFKTISVPHTLIKLSQPVNYQENIKALQEQVAPVIDRNNNKNQMEIQRDILKHDIKRISNNDTENIKLENVSSEINWFLILNAGTSSEIITLKDQLIKDFAKLKIDLTLLSQNQLTNTFISLYAPYISFNDKNILDANSENWNEILNFNNIEFFQNALKVKPFFANSKVKTYDTYMKVGVLKSYPTITPPFAWLYKLATSFDAMVIHNNMVDKDEIHKLINQSFENTELKRANTTNRSKKGEMEFLYNSFKQLSDSISSGNEIIYDTSIYTINYSFESPLAAIRSYNQSKTMAKSLGFFISPLTYEQRKGFGDLFIKSDMLLPKLKFPLPAYCYAYGFPFINGTINDAKGIILGKTHKKEDFIFDMTKIDNVRKNHNMFILGNSGTGKSTFLKLLWMHLYGRGHKIFLIDPESEADNRQLVKNLHGTYIDMSQTPINPFIINIYNEDQKSGRLTYDVDNKASWLSEWLSTIFGWDNSTKNVLNKSILANWITNFYDYLDISTKEVSLDISWPSVGQFYTYLKTQMEILKSRDANADLSSESDILKMLDTHFVSGNTIPKKLWNTTSNIVDTSKSYLNSFDISKLVNMSSNIQKASYMLLLDLANKEMWRNKLYNDSNKKRIFDAKSDEKWNETFLFLIFDEGHLMVDRKNPMTTSFLAETGARCRKYSTSLIIATQNVKTFTGDPEILYHSTRIINNTQYSMSLGLKENDIAELDKLWEPIGGLTEQEKEYLSNAQKGDCIFSTSSQTRTQLQIDIGGDSAFKKYASMIKNDHEIKVQEIRE